MRQYLLVALLIYLLTVLSSFLIYLILVLVEKRFPIVTVCAYSIGESLLRTFYFFSAPFRFLLPNLTDDEYYLLLVNGIITTFAFAYAYLFCKFSASRRFISF